MDKIDQETMLKMRRGLIDLAHKVAGNFDIKLDYSVESIKLVEDILAKLHEDYKKTKNREGIDGLAMEFSAYIIEVIERNNLAGGQWKVDSIEMGPRTFPYVIDNKRTIFPVAWCRTRIVKGDDNVWVKFSSTMLENKVS